MSTSLDTEKFSRMIKSKRGKIGLRNLANDIGISASTLSRVEQGNLPDIDTYLKLCNWLEVSSDYFLMNRELSDTDSHKGVIAHLRADKTLPPTTSEALIQMINLAYESAKKEA
ncbi:MAG: helix-turn-helix transcriptional regulator [Bacteroidota bacterium]